MTKELRPVHDDVSCDVCGRTILKGERTEAFQSADGRRYAVCQLCTVRAEGLGWIRASIADEAFARAPRPEPRRSLMGRLRKRATPDREASEAEPPAEAYDLDGNGEALPDGDEEVEVEQEPSPQQRPTKEPSRPKHPRHVRAVPTTPNAKVERALDLFNASEHQRTIAGLARTLGTPWVAAVPELEQATFVTVVVAWELSWYRFRIDLGDAVDPVTQAANGEELDQIDESHRDWNATIDDEGRLIAGNAVATEGAGE